MQFLYAEGTYNIIGIFGKLGKSGGCCAAFTEALSRSIVLAIRAGAKPEEIASELKGIRCQSPVGLGDRKVESCPDAFAKGIEKWLAYVEKMRGQVEQ